MVRTSFTTIIGYGQASIFSPDHDWMHHAPAWFMVNTILTLVVIFGFAIERHVQKTDRKVQHCRKARAGEIKNHGSRQADTEAKKCNQRNQHGANTG